jgi:hypothetical protein
VAQKALKEAHSGCHTAYSPFSVSHGRHKNKNTKNTEKKQE